MPIVFTLAFASTALAQDDAARVDEARALFSKGTDLAKDAHWAEALASFERSATLRPHAVTTYNIAQCFRAMGHYTRARAKFVDAVARGEANAGELPDTLAADAKGHVDEIDRLLAHVMVTIAPADASLAVDGAPLAPARGADQATPKVIAGLLPAGLGTPPPATRVEVLVDPGLHIFTLSRRGFRDIARRDTFAEGSTTELRLEADKLPAVLHVSSTRDAAIVTVDGVDVGPVPVDVKRGAGSYRVVVRRAGYVTYDTTVTVQAGEDVELRAPLEPEETPITKRWWFWTAAGALVVGAATATYFLTRPDPTRPDVNGGGLGWKVPVR